MKVSHTWYPSQKFHTNTKPQSAIFLSAILAVATEVFAAPASLANSDLTARTTYTLTCTDDACGPSVLDCSATGVVEGRSGYNGICLSSGGCLCTAATKRSELVARTTYVLNCTDDACGNSVLECSAGGVVEGRSGYNGICVSSNACACAPTS